MENNNPIVGTESGKVRGYRYHNVSVFKGIPFAAPPIGEKRFTPPQPIKPWVNILDAIEFGPVAPQPASALELGGEKKIQSEAECLTLNIWTPETDNQKRPVLMWIHGGSFITGTGADTNGSRMALRGNVIVVSINYRLGILGFLYIPGKTANIGLLDQVEALKWVKHNIEYFGGDSTNITIVGESAGSTAISALMTMPSAKGLFKRAILESSACYSYAHKPANGAALGEKIFSTLKIPYGDLTGIRNVPVEQLLAVYSKVTATEFDRNVYPPFVDGEVLTLNPVEAIRKGVAKDIEMLAGNNNDEATMWSLWDAQVNTYTEASLSSRFEYVLAKLGQSKETAERIFNYYYNNTSDHSPGGLREVWEAFHTDYRFRIGVLRYLEEQSIHQPEVYAYQFNWKTPELGGRLGATHSLEIPFVFGTLGGKPSGIFPQRTPESDLLSSKMMHAWINFARYGNPNHPDIPIWNRYDTVKRATMLFDKETQELYGNLAELSKLWEGII